MGITWRRIVVSGSVISSLAWWTSGSETVATGMTVNETKGTATSETVHPTYVRWAQIARDAATKEYPDSSIVDFEHVGRRNQGNGVAIEVFQVWLVHNHKEVGLVVSVSFEQPTDRFIGVHFKPIQS